MVWDPVTDHMAGPPRGTQFLRESDRGVSTVVGFVMIVALLVITLSIYQSDVVPNQNAEIEHQYSQSLDGEFADLRATVDDVATSGAPASTTIDGGPDYPTRALAINGPEPAGRLRTTNASNVILEGLQSVGDGYWDGSERSFETRLLEFQPRYNFLQLDERYYLENGVGVKVVDDGAYTSALDDEIVEGDRIDIVLLDGEIDEQDRVHDVQLKPISTNNRYLTVEPTGEETTVTIPTVRNEAAWNGTADGNPNVNGTDLTCRGADPDPPCASHVNDVTLVLNQSVDSYDLRVTKLGLESAPKPEATYLTTTSVTSGLAADRTQEFQVTARDRYGNPTDAEVELVGGGGGTFRPGTTLRTGRDGATFQYEPGAGNAANFKARINNGRHSYQRIEFSLGPNAPGDGTRVFEVYNDGQLFQGFGEIGSIRVSDVYATEETLSGCLLGDVDEGLLGLLSELTCIDGTIDVSQFTATLHGESGTHRLEFKLVDEDQDGDLYTGGDSYDGNDVATVRLFSHESLVDGEPVFAGTIHPGDANHLYKVKEGKRDLFDEDTYRDLAWERTCVDEGFWWGECDEYQYGIESFDELRDAIGKISAVYVDHADGHTTVEIAP